MKKTKKIAVMASSLIFISGMTCGIAVMGGLNALENSVTVSADDSLFEGLKYITNEDGSITITGYTDQADLVDLIIPDEIDGKPVTAVGDNAFYKCYTLSSLKLGKNINSIGQYAFAGYNDPYSTCDTYINLSEVTLPDNLQTIGKCAFDATNISKLSVPASVSSIPDTLLFHEALTEINVNAENKKYFSDNGVLYSADKSTLIRCPQKFASDSYSVFDETTSIGNKAFCWCYGLSSIKMGKNVKSIGEYAFAGYYNKYGSDTYMNISEVTLPDNIEAIGTGAFECTNISKLSVPASVSSVSDTLLLNQGLTEINVAAENKKYFSDNGVLYSADKSTIIRCPQKYISDSYSVLDQTTTIDNKAFYRCFDLSSIKMGKNIKSIGEYAFAGQYNQYSSDVYMNISQLTLPDNIEAIGEHAFECTHLSKLSVPASVLSISDTFTSNTALTEINVEEGNATYSSDNGVLYSADKKVLIRCPKKFSLPSYTVTDSTTAIGDYAFYGCTNTFSVVLGKNVTSIGNFAFARLDNKSSYSSITLPDKLETVGDKAFDTVISKLSVPASVSYIPDILYSNSYLTEIDVEKGNSNYYSDNGVLYSADKTTLIRCPQNLSTKSYKILDEATSVSPKAFYDCTKISNLELGNNLTEFGKDAFTSMTISTLSVPALSSVVPEELYSINTLTQITVDEENPYYSSENGVLYSGDKFTLFKCPVSLDLLIFNISEKTGNVKPSAFEGTKIQIVTIPESVIIIGENAFKKGSLNTIKGVAGSYAQSYATDNKYKFVELTPSTVTTSVPSVTSVTTAVSSTTPKATTQKTTTATAVTTKAASGTAKVTAVSKPVTTPSVKTTTVPVTTAPPKTTSAPVTSAVKPKFNYDVNGDGKINIMDIMYLKKYILNSK